MMAGVCVYALGRVGGVWGGGGAAGSTVWRSWREVLISHTAPPLRAYPPAPHICRTQELESMHRLEMSHLANFLEGQIMAGKYAALRESTFGRKRALMQGQEL